MRMLDYIGEEDKQRENVIGGFHLRSTSMEDVAHLRPVALDLSAINTSSRITWAPNQSSKQPFVVAKI